MHRDLGFYRPTAGSISDTSVIGGNTGGRDETQSNNYLVTLNSAEDADEVGPSLPTWEARPPPPPTPMLGHFCSLEPLSAAAHSDDLFEAYSAPTEKDVWTYTGPETGDPTDSRSVFYIKTMIPVDFPLKNVVDFLLKNHVFCRVSTRGSRPTWRILHG